MINPAPLISADIAAWETGFEHLVAYTKANGSARVLLKHETAEGYPLGSWVGTQHGRKLRDRISAKQRERLEALKGWVWDANIADWETGFEHLVAYTKANGSVKVPRKHETAEGYRLGSWVKKQRAKEDRLSAKRRERLEALKGWAWITCTKRSTKKS
jgi:hypothetical protein